MNNLFVFTIHYLMILIKMQTYELSFIMFEYRREKITFDGFIEYLN